MKSDGRELSMKRDQVERRKGLRREAPLRRGEGRGCAFVATSLLHHGLGQMVDGQRPDDFHFAVAVANPGTPEELRACEALDDWELPRYGAAVLRALRTAG